MAKTITEKLFALGVVGVGALAAFSGFKAIAAQITDNVADKFGGASREAGIRKIVEEGSYGKKFADNIIKQAGGGKIMVQPAPQVQQPTIHKTPKVRSPKVPGF